MTNWKIYYNPQCSKCREALSLLNSHNIEPQVIEYLKTGISKDELIEIFEKLDDQLGAVVRTKDEDYQKLKFDLNSKEAIIANLTQNARLLERPIVVTESRAVVARPVEKILKLL